jgi:hypothetical protein
MRIYELWDGATRNLVNAYETEAEALAAVRQLVADHGRDYALPLALLWDEAEDNGLIADGEGLIALATNAVSNPIAG